MGLFSKIKNMFKRTEEEEKVEQLEEEQVEEQSIEEPVYEEEQEEKKAKEEVVEKVKENKKEQAKEEAKESVKVYEKGLTKTRENFVSKLISLTKRYNKVSEEYFDELEEILIMADIGVDTVMSFMDRLRKRVRSENIEDLEYLKEVIVDELFIIYVNDDIIVNKIN